MWWGESHLPGVTTTWWGHSTPQEQGLDVPPAHLRATRKVIVSLLGISQEMEGSPYCWQEKEAIFLLNQAAPVSKVPQRNPTALRAGLFMNKILINVQGLIFHSSLAWL